MSAATPRLWLDVSELEEAAGWLEAVDEGTDPKDPEYADVCHETARRLREIVDAAKASRKRNANGWWHIVIEVQNPVPAARPGEQLEEGPGVSWNCNHCGHRSDSAHEALAHLGEAHRGATSRRLVTEQAQPQRNDNPAVWGLVVDDMIARDEEGRLKYGTPLQPHNGRDALVDAYQESLDLCVYLRQAIYERNGR